MQGYKIELQIYADNAQEAEQGREAIVSFINLMRNYGVAVSGSKISKAIDQIKGNNFILGQVVNYLK